MALPRIWFALSTGIICRCVSGFVADCPCGVWCHGLTICPCILVHYLAKLFWVRLLIWYEGEYFWLCICFFFRTLIYIYIYKYWYNLVCFIVSFWITSKLIEVRCTSVFLTFSDCQRNVRPLFDSLKGIILKPVLTYIFYAPVCLYYHVKWNSIT